MKTSSMFGRKSSRRETVAGEGFPLDPVGCAAGAPPEVDPPHAASAARPATPTEPSRNALRSVVRPGAPAAARDWTGTVTAFFISDMAGLSPPWLTKTTGDSA